VVLGGPAGVGFALLFAHLRSIGADPSVVINTRAVVSFAWVAGPPLATFIIDWFGTRAVLAALAAVAFLNIVTTAVMLVDRSRTEPAPAPPGGPEGDQPSVSNARTGVMLAVFVALQATNYAVVSIMGLFVTDTLNLDVTWAGIALGVAAGLEIPALLLLGRLSSQISDHLLIASGCVAGVAYYLAMAAVTGPVLLLGVQALNAWFVAVVSGTGLALFQRVIPRPGLATGLYVNTRRIGAIVAGPLISLGALTTLGHRSVFIACTALTVAALVGIRVLARLDESAGVVGRHRLAAPRTVLVIGSRKRNWRSRHYYRPLAVRPLSTGSSGGPEAAPQLIGGFPGVTSPARAASRQGGAVGPAGQFS